jgi:regulator of sigma E protease
VNLGIVNLLPIPALDGARILFLTAEGIRRKPLNQNTEAIIHFVGFALLMLLIIVVTFNDVRKLIVGG